MNSFKALRIHNNNNVIQARFENITLGDLSPGDVVIRSAYSSINYKDALAATGAGKILRHYPLVGGIDVAGTVVTSNDMRFKEGDAVLVTGCSLSETLDGGYSEYVRVPSTMVIPLPKGLSLHDSMAIGTAGFSAALAIQRMQDNGQTPEKGSIVVTGATGGVGSLAIDMLVNAGYQVVALTNKTEQIDYLKKLGVQEILPRSQVDLGNRPLEAAQWGGAIDNVGGDILGWLTRTVKPWGTIASVGLAGGAHLNTTVMPFILRAVSLLGINSGDTPPVLRYALWQRLATDLRPRHLQQIVTRTVKFDDLLSAFPEYINGKVVGRTVVSIAPQD